VIVVMRTIVLPWSSLRHRQENYSYRRKQLDIVDRVYEDMADAEQRVRCPYCAEWILPQAVICKHCGRTVRS
ncbi:MAG: hypothetical protein JW910_20660, partial [Anaerolineae bacterium]|nr:hypothetical protein [Anaerolineae bacterium]